MSYLLKYRKADFRYQWTIANLFNNKISSDLYSDKLMTDQFQFVGILNPF